MLNQDDYEILKKNLALSQKLFHKLSGVIHQLSELVYDESGFYIEYENTYLRHRAKLSARIIDVLQDSLDGFTIELLTNESFENKNLMITFRKEKELSKISVDFSEDGVLSILQIA